MDVKYVLCCFKAWLEWLAVSGLPSIFKIKWHIFTLMTAVMLVNWVLNSDFGPSANAWSPVFSYSSVAFSFRHVSADEWTSTSAWMARRRSSREAFSFSPGCCGRATPASCSTISIHCCSWDLLSRKLPHWATVHSRRLHHTNDYYSILPSYREAS